MEYKIHFVKYKMKCLLLEHFLKELKKDKEKKSKEDLEEAEQVVPLIQDDEIMPHHIFIINGSDEYLKQRMSEIPEEEKVGHISDENF